MAQNTDLWRQRFEAVARAQSRYLYVLLVAGVFYLALDSQIHVAFQERPRSVTLPIVGVPVDPIVVWATAPTVLGLICLAALGTFPALRFAYKRMECGEDDEAFEARDIVPTAIDFVVYCRTWRLPSALGLLAYPTALTLFVWEGTWLWLRIHALRDAVNHSCVLLVLGFVVMVFAWGRLPAFWVYKGRRAWRKLARRGPGPAASENTKVRDCRDSG